MAWQHRGTTAPPFSYEATPYPNPAYRNPHYGPPPPPGNSTPYGTQTVHSHPAGRAPYEHQSGFPYHLPQQAPRPGDDQQLYDHRPHGHNVQPGPWRHEYADPMKFERTPSTETYQSPDSHRPPHTPFHHPTSSARGGRRHDNRPISHPSSESSYRGPSPRFALHRPLQHGLRRNDLSRNHDSSERDEWEIPRSAIKPASSKNSAKLELEAREPDKTQTDEEKDKNGDEGTKDEDPLAILANVSSEMDSSKRSKTSESTKDTTTKTEGSTLVDQPEKESSDHVTNKSSDTNPPTNEIKGPPTSPLQRRIATSSPLITPNMSTETDQSANKKDQGKAEPSRQVRQRVVRTLTPKPITPTAAPHYHHYQQKPEQTPVSYTPYDDTERPRDYPYYNSAGSFPPPPPTTSYVHKYPPPSYVPVGRDPSWEQPQHSPVVVEHNSFDSGESSGMRYPADFSYHRYHGPPPPPSARHYPGESPYPHSEPAESTWHSGGPPRDEKAPDYTAPPSPYPAHRWSYDGPPPSPREHGAGHFHGPPMPGPYHQYPPTGGPPTRVPHYPTPSPYFHPPTEAAQYNMSNKGTPEGGQHYSPMPVHHMAPYPMYHAPPGYPPHVLPYPYSHAQQQSVDEKTVLRKKFSWKHFPEVSFNRTTFSLHCLLCAWTYISFSFLFLISYVLA